MENKCTIFVEYVRQRKILFALLGIYIVLALTLFVYIIINSENIFASGSPFSITGKNTNPIVANPVTTSVNKNNTNTTNNSSSSSGSSTSNSGGSEDNHGENTDSITATVAFYSDTQEDTDSEDANHLRVVDYILGSGANPVFHAGDVMEDGSQNSMDRFNNVTSALRSSRTFYAALGNNDRVVGDPSTPSNIFLDFFSFPNNERWYSVNSGNLHLIVLDSAFASMASGSAQYNWLVSDLQSEDAKSRIVGVMYHHPSSTLSALFSSEGVDFVINGHIHSYSKSSSGGVYYFTLSGQTSIGYVVSQVYSNRVKINSYDSSNNLIDSETIYNR